MIPHACACLPLIRVFCYFAFTAVGMLPSIVCAQEVTLIPVEWVNSFDPPDQLPVLQGAAAVEFPQAMRETDQVGYVISRMVLDQSGKVLDVVRHASSPVYLDAVRHAEENAKWLPGRRDGKPVVTSVTYSHVFNPASAGVDRSDATPRLLEAGVGYLPVKAVVFGRPSRESTPSRVGVGSEAGMEAGKEPAAPPKLRDSELVKAEITVGLDGKISSVESVPDEYLRAVRIEAKNWRFAPARQKGEPVVSTINADFLLVGPRERSANDRLVPPKVIRQFKPVYPLAMRINGMRAEVVVGFVVDIEGRAVHAGVLRSDNPLFDDAAIEAVRKWTFQPGMRNGVPMNTRMQVPIQFSIQGVKGGGSGPFVTKKKGDLSKLPEAFQYDTPPVPVSYLPPVYPYALLREGVRGRAVVAYIVNEEGAVVQVRLQEASTPEFGAALVAAVEAFQFRPALKKGVPCLAMMVYQESFEGDGIAQLVGNEGTNLIRREKKKPQSIHGPDDLDDALKVSFRMPPIFPLNAKSDKGKAVVEFILDETGRARLPRIVNSSEDVFGYAAVQAVSTWRFAAPMVGGKPAAVRVRAPFAFEAVEKRK
ncbi:MAG: TonB family protein [Opitutaceae bacterium]|nr:TonB family protein [Opitutaceae bacterium]